MRQNMKIVLGNVTRSYLSQYRNASLASPDIYYLQQISCLPEMDIGTAELNLTQSAPWNFAERILEQQLFQSIQVEYFRSSKIVKINDYRSLRSWIYSFRRCDFDKILRVSYISNFRENTLRETLRKVIGSDTSWLLCHYSNKLKFNYWWFDVKFYIYLKIYICINLRIHLKEFSAFFYVSK